MSLHYVRFSFLLQGLEGLWREEPSVFFAISFFALFLVEISKKKKKLPQFAADTLPAPRPLPLLEKPPSWDSQ